MKPVVVLARDDDVGKAVTKVLDQLALPDLEGKNVLLKPNVGREERAGTAINTNPAVVKAVFKFLSNKFNANYFIGDSPIINTDTRKAFHLAGFEDVIAEPGLTFIDLDEKSPVKLPIPGGLILDSIEVSGYLPDMDYIISIPVAKMHMHTGASLGFKNMKGVIYKRNKITLHHLEAPGVIARMEPTKRRLKELDVAIADLARVIKPDLVVIDATEVQEGMGPSSGTAVKLDTVIASTDYLAADIVALKIIQPNWDLGEVPHLKIISDQQGGAVKSVDDIKTVPEDLSDFMHQIEPPPTSVSIKYNNVKVIDIDSCSACLSTIFTFLKTYKDFIDAHFTKEHPLVLAIGKGLGESDLYQHAFLVGNCTSNRKDDGIFIKGCTPVQSRLYQAIKDYLETRS